VSINRSGASRGRSLTRCPTPCRGETRGAIFGARGRRKILFVYGWLVGLAIAGAGCCKIFHLGWSSGWVEGADFVGRVRATPELVERASPEDGSLDRDACIAACEVLDPPGEFRSCRYRRGPPPAPDRSAPLPSEEAIECVYWIPGHCGSPHLS